VISSEAERYLQMDSIEGLEAAWADSTLSLAERARLVSRLQMKSRLTLEGAARACDASPAEMQALLELSTLDDDDLELVSRANPPATTWLLFSGADSESIRVGVEAFESASAGEPILASVYVAMRSELGPDLDERIAGIGGETIAHLARKAVEYGKLTEWQQNFLASIGRCKKLGKALTEKQLNQLRIALFDLVETGVVRRDSPDGDQAQCDEVLDAMGL